MLSPIPLPPRTSPLHQGLDEKGYRYVDTLCSGANTEIIKVEKDSLMYVAKTTDVSSMSESCKRPFLAEAQMMMSLRHENIVFCPEYFVLPGLRGSSDEYIVIIMEYCERGDLAKFLKDLEADNGKMKECELQQIFHDVVCGMVYLHSKNIAHLDVKPGNIVLTKSGIAKIIDFGTSRVLNNAEVMDDMFISTPIYMAPEFWGKKCSTKSDVWSLGCLLYEMLYLRHAFNYNKCLLNSILNSDVPMEASIYNSEWIRLLSFLLIKDERKRPSIVDVDGECATLLDCFKVGPRVEQDNSAWHVVVKEIGEQAGVWSFGNSSDSDAATDVPEGPFSPANSILSESKFGEDIGEFHLGDSDGGRRRLSKCRL